MGADISTLAGANDLLAEAVVPANGHTPPRVERLDQLSASADILGGGLAELTDRGVSVYGNRHTIRVAGAFCTLAGMRELVADDSVTYATAGEVHGELMRFGDQANRAQPEWRSDPHLVGALAEVAVMKTVWGALDDGFVGRGHAFLTSRNQTHGPGLRGDVDVAGHLDGERARLQVKTSLKREGYVYRPGIAVVSTEGLVPDRHRQSSVSYLLDLHKRSLDERAEAYGRLRAKLAA